MKHSFSHFDSKGNAVMVDVSDKTVTEREAIAKGKIRMSQASFDAIREERVGKGDVLSVARIAGIMGTKRTSDLIPLCHPLMMEKASISFSFIPDDFSIEAICTVKTSGRTGVEMEALTGVSITLLTIYDMCKAIDKGMELHDIHLSEKRGGKSGEYKSEKGGDDS